MLKYCFLFERMNYSYLVLILFCTLMTETAYSQNWEIGVSVGGSGYTGDLNPTGYLKHSGVGFGANVKRNFDGYWALKLAVTGGRVAADDLKSKYEDQKNRGLNFSSPITEGSLQLEFNFFDFGIDWGQQRITPFIYSGISYFGFNPKATYGGKTYELKIYGTEVDDSQFVYGNDVYKTTAFAVPVGAGVKFRLNNHLNVAADFGFRTAFTDYLDDVSMDYPVIDPNKNTFNGTRAALSDPTGYSNSKQTDVKIQRGDYRPRDTYFFSMITISYVFRNKDCPF